MRKLRTSSAGRKKTRPKEPLAEGIIVPLEKSGRRSWRSMSDVKLVEYASKFIEERGIKFKSEFREADRGLYGTLWSRGLLGSVRIKDKKRPRDFFTKMSDTALIEYAKKIIREKRIKNKNELQKEDGGLYTTLLKRKLFDKLGLGKKFRKRRNWSSMSDEEIVQYAQEAIDEMGLTSANQLKKRDSGLLLVLEKKKLISKLEFGRPERAWHRYEDDELVDYVNTFVKKKEIKSPKELEKKDRGLCDTLYRRKLMEKVEFPKRKRKPRDWGSLTDSELIRYASDFIFENKLMRRSELQKIDVGLYHILRKRKLLDKLKFEKKKPKRRDWASMSDDELIEYAKGFIEEKKIKNKKELEKEDSGLHSTLRNRKLIDRLEFEEGRRKQRDWSSMSDDELVGYAQRFLEEKGIENRKRLARKDVGLYSALLRRKLLDKLEFGEGLRRWASMSDGELVEYAKNFMTEKKIESKKGLNKKDRGLYDVLGRRKLLNLVFSDIEKAKEKQAVQDVFDALREFGGPG